MSTNANLKLGVNLSVDGASTEAANQKIAEVERANLAMLSNVRQGVQIGIFAIRAMGTALDQTMTLLVEAVFLSVEVALQIQAAIAASSAGASLGFLAFTSILTKGLTVLSMGFLIYQIRTKKAESARRTSNIVSGLRMASFR